MRSESSNSYVSDPNIFAIWNSLNFTKFNLLLNLIV